MPGSKRPGSKYAFITFVFDGVMRTPEPGRRNESPIVFLWGDQIQYSMWFSEKQGGKWQGWKLCAFVRSSSGVIWQLKKAWRTSEAYPSHLLFHYTIKYKAILEFESLNNLQTCILCIPEKRVMVVNY